MLTRLIYASEVPEPLAGNTIEEIVDQARVRNVRDHVTGMLAFDHKSFLQVLEGRREVVSGLFCRIARDPRHRRIQLLESTAVDERLFGNWAMGFAAANAFGRETFLRFSNSDRFEPSTLSARAALGLLSALAAR